MASPKPTAIATQSFRGYAGTFIATVYGASLRVFNANERYQNVEIGGKIHLIFVVTCTLIVYSNSFRNHISSTEEDLETTNTYHLVARIKT